MDSLNKTPSLRDLLIFLGVIIGIIVFVIIILLAPVAIFFHSTELESRESLNNPIINSDYEDWKVVLLGNNNTFLIPNEWIIVEEGNYLTISDDCGSTIAQGVLLRFPFKNKDVEAFYRRTVPFNYGERTAVYLKPKEIRTQSEYFEVVFTKEDEKQKYFELRLFTLDAEIFILFEADDDNQQDLMSKIEAIAFSYNHRNFSRNTSASYTLGQATDEIGKIDGTAKAHDIGHRCKPNKPRGRCWGSLLMTREKG